MNFTPNPANALGRVQQQQVHQVPVTSASSAPQSANSQKIVSLPNPSFPINQQAANIQLKINDGKSQLPPTSVHHQQSAQNNNNHGMSATPQQIINVQNQSNMNRNLNISHQATFQQAPQHLVTSIGQGVPKVGIFEQMQQMAQFSQAPPVSQSQQGLAYHTGLQGQQNALHKLQTVAMPQSVHTAKTVTDPSGLPIQQKLQSTFTQSVQAIKIGAGSQQSQLQQLKPVSSQLPPSVSLHLQFSPPKSAHPQMKTTAKLASPGSQLQSLQKSPTAPNPPQLMVQQTSQNKTVPSTPPALSPAPSVSNASSSQPGPTVSVTPVKTQVPSAAKQSPVSAAQVASLVSANAAPSQSVTVSPKPTAPASSGTEHSPIKAEPSLSATNQTKPVPKLSIDEKKVAQAQNNSSAPETNNKLEKFPLASASSAEKQQAVVAPAKANSPSKSTMRLATVTPARQKKQPATNNNKKPASAASPVPNVQKAPARAAPASLAKSETPKAATNAKKSQPQPSTSVAVTPKSNPAPSTSSAQSTSSSASGSGTSPKTKRSRVKVQPYQSPTPELALVTKLSTQAAKTNNKNGNDDKLTIFYKNEFLAVRNPEGGFYLCQAMHNVYKSSPKIRIHWLNDKNEGKVSSTGGQIYVLDYYDVTDFECVLTTVELTKVEAKSYELSKEEQARIESILKKAIDVEKGILPRPTVTEENPDGLDLSLYKDEAQLDKTSPNKRKLSDESIDNDFDFDDDEDYEVSPKKKSKVKAKPESATKRARGAAKKQVVNDESTESDEENLMEIKKKAKRQAAIATPSKAVPTKAPEPIPSTSKAAQPPATGRGGRKRAAKSPEVEVPEKVTKTVEKVEAVKEPPAEKQTTPKAKVAAKPKAVKKSSPEKAPIVALEKRPVVEKKSPAEKKPPAAKKADATKSPAVPSPKAVQEKTPQPATPKKKVSPKAKATTSPALVVLDQQPSTSRSRNTRSKK